MSERVEASPRKPLIWICDDSATESQLTRASLGPVYEYEHFVDGTSVIERIASRARLPDVLLLDWVMPAMNGDDVCRFLRQHPATIELPIIILTASRIETSDVVQGLSVGANDYLARPFVAEELCARVETLIRSKRLRETAARERSRLAAVGRLGRALLDTGPSFPRVLETLARSLVESLADGCGISIIPGATDGMTTTRHRTVGDTNALAGLGTLADPIVHTFDTDDQAKATLPAAYHALVDQVGIGALAVIPFPPRAPCTGVVTVTRDRRSEPFDDKDIATIETCLEYASLAFENALRFDAERTARQHMQTIIEQLPIAILVADRNNKFTQFNQSAIDLMPSLARSRDIGDVRAHVRSFGKDGAEVLPDDGLVARALRGESVRGLELELRSDTHASRFVRANAVPLRDAHDEVDAAVIAIDDISDEHAVAAEREQTVKFQQYVLGIVSHDLRTPLQTLFMGCDGVRLAAPGNAKVMQYVDRLQATAKRMQGIVEQLLDVTRTRLAGGIPFTPSSVELGTIVTGVLDEIGLAFPQARFATLLGSARGLWDADRLAQVAANLIGNAIVHGVKGATIEIETLLAGETASLRVTNKTQGNPLDKDQIEKLFSPFRRAATPKGGSGGLGLGLYIAAEIVRAHRGEIVVEANPDTTTFLVRLPTEPPPTPRRVVGL